MSTNRILVDAKIYDEFVERFVAKVKSFKVGNPNEPDTFIGPIINAKQLQGLQYHIKTAQAGGARQLLGGDAVGQVLPPHIFVDVKNDMLLAQTELFGPVAPIIKFQNEAEALQIANDTPYGLSGAVFTRDEGRGLKFALGVKAGMTHINDCSVDDTPTGPFGGEKNSGLGRFGGEWIIEEFTRVHWITIRHG